MTATGGHADELTALGPYRLRGKLGEGGMGVVHLGLDGAGRAVAVKVLRSHIAHDPEARARLAREVTTLRRVQHPFVAGVIDADVDGDQPYIVTRFVPGPGLDEVVRDHGPLAPPDLLRLGRGLSGALQAIHAVHVVHRDLKPANVLLADGDPVVIDFGIAHVADDVRLTSTGLVMGTPGYLSPEVIDGERVSEATDWWGWAATLAFAASGRPPFGRGPMDVVIDRVRRGQCDLDGVDARLRPLLLAALAVDPRRRPGTGEVLDALDRYAQGDPATVTIPVQPQPTRALPAGPSMRAPEGEAFSPYSPAQAYAPPPAPAPVSPYVPMEELLPVREPGDVPPARPGRRSGVVAGLLLALVAGALAVPLVAAAVALVLAVLARTVDHNRVALARRRLERGPRRSDGFVATLSAPWHLLSALVGSVLAALLPVLLGLATAFCAGLLVPAADGSPSPGSLPAVGAGAFVALLAGWWGVGGGSLRRGARTVLRRAVPASHQLTWVLLLLLVAAGLAAWAVRTGSPQWWPLHQMPFGLPA
ncbi:MAG TPA: serine/threonine-protein kinase [Angustibacter sp.]|nr:serine/threonine-protein kinase [Angustibacter sp.]